MELSEDRIKYECSYGSGHTKVIWVAVSPAVQDFLLACQRKQNAQDRQSRRHISSYDLETVSFFIPSQVCVEEDAIRNILAKKVRKAMRSLPDIQRRRITMRYYQGLTVREIAENEGVRVNSIDKTLGLALENLKKNYGNWRGGKRRDSVLITVCCSMATAIAQLRIITLTLQWRQLCPITV